MAYSPRSGLTKSKSQNFSVMQPTNNEFINSTVKEELIKTWNPQNAQPVKKLSKGKSNHTADITRKLSSKS
jgi:hypothetical protein